MTNEQLQHWLSCFVLEVRKMNGQPYPPDTVHHIIFDIMRHLHQQGKQLDIFWDMCFPSSERSLIPKWSSWKLQVLLSRAVKQSHFLHRKKINCGALVSWETTVLGHSLTQFYSKMDWILLCRVEASTGDWGSTTAWFKLSNEKESVLSSVTLKIPPRTTKEELKNKVWPQNSRPVWQPWQPSTMSSLYIQEIHTNVSIKLSKMHLLSSTIAKTQANMLVFSQANRTTYSE